MINGKNMFTFQIRKLRSQKEFNSIIPDDPSNIFEYTGKKRKIVNFDNIFVKGKQKTKPVKNVEFNNKVIQTNKLLFTKNIKKSNGINKNVKKIDFDNALLQSSSKCRTEISKENLSNKKLTKNGKMQPVTFVLPSTSTFVEHSIEVVNVNKKEKESQFKSELPMPIIKDDTMYPLTIGDCTTVTDVILLFTKTEKSNYSTKLKDLLVSNKNMFNSICEDELKDLENKIEQVDIQKDKWYRVKSKVIKENFIDLSVYTKESFTEENLFLEDFDMTTIGFIKNNMKNYLVNLTERLNEIEEKIFSLTKNEQRLDPIILLNALTKYN